MVLGDFFEVNAGKFLSELVEDVSRTDFRDDSQGLPETNAFFSEEALEVEQLVFCRYPVLMGSQAFERSMFKFIELVFWTAKFGYLPVEHFGLCDFKLEDGAEAVDCT